MADMSQNISEREQFVPDAQVQKRNRRSWKKIGICLLLALVILAIPFYYFGRAAGSVHPWSWQRSQNEETPKPGNGFSASAGVFLSKHSATGGWGSSRSENACVDFRAVTVCPGSGHPLAIACAERIAAKLREIPEIHQVDFIAAEPILGKTKPLPQFLVRVDVPEINEWSLPNRSMTATINVAYGTSIARKNHHFGSTDTPLVDIDANTGYTIKCSHTGVVTQAGFYGKIADDIAKKFIGSLANMISDETRKSTQLPDLPEAFYPAYCEASEVPAIPGDVSRTVLVDGRRLMVPHYSLVQIDIETDREPTELLAELQQAMNEAGWKGEFSPPGIDGSPHLRMTRGYDNEIYYLFQEPKQNQNDFSMSALTDTEKAIAAKPAQAQPASERHVFMLERTMNVNRESVLAAIGSLQEANAPVSTWLLFTRHLYGNEPQATALRDRVFELVRGSKPETPAEQLALVRFYEQHGSKDEAKEALFLAWQLRKLATHPVSDSTYETIAKKLEVLDEMKALPKPTPELCAEHGFVSVTPEMCPWETEIEPDKDARFIVLSGDDNVTVCIVKVRPQGNQLSTSCFATTLRDHGSSSSSMITSSSGVMFGFNAGEDHFQVGLVSGQTSYSGGPIRVKFQKQ